MHPYIGITDFANFEQVQDMLSIFDAHLPKESNRKLHVGVMMSYKTFCGVPSKWQDVFPPKEALPGIFASDQTYNCLHYADYDDKTDFRILSQAIFYADAHLHALQLDMVWPDPGMIASGVHTSRKPIEVILQIGKSAIEQARNDLKIVVKKLGDYDGVIHRVLLDKSMGKGLGMDACGLIPFARAIRQNFPKLGIGAAGGLGPDTMHLVETLAKEFPDLSIDAQGKLRPSGNAMDPIDWEMAGAYLAKALELFG